MKTLKLCKKFFFTLMLSTVLTSCINTDPNLPFGRYNGPALVTKFSEKTMLKSVANQFLYSSQLNEVSPPLTEGTPVLINMYFYEKDQVSEDYFVGVLDYLGRYVECSLSEKDSEEDDYNAAIVFDDQEDILMKIDNTWFIHFHILYQDNQKNDYELIYLPVESDENKFTFYFKTKITTEGAGASRKLSNGVAVDLTDFIMQEGIRKDREKLRYDFIYVYDNKSDGTPLYKTLFTDKVLWENK